MIKKVLLASHNTHKKAEIQEMLELYGIHVIGTDDLRDTDEPIEDGKDFYENSYIKAKFFYDRYRMPTIADDSGLCISYLDDKPGIHSARFMSHLDYAQRNELICSIMRDVPNRRASFYSVVCYIDDGGTHWSTGILEGTIADAPKGDNGFGYDPIFIADGEDRTLAEMQEEEKNAISHRSMAIYGLGEFFE